VPGAVRRAEYGRGRVRLEVEVTVPGWLVLRDLYSPGWDALVDGQPAEIRSADTAFRAVRLAAGRHEVLFLYRPASFRIGLVVSILAALAIAAGLFGERIGAGWRYLKARGGMAAPGAGSLTS
jgi:uncharacterized membrane protein YfhO